MTNTPAAKQADFIPSALPDSERPIEEQWRIAAGLWVEADELARAYDERKSIYIAEQKNALCKFDAKLSDAAAERRVRASEKYEDFITQMVEAKTKANKLRVQMDYLKMKHEKWRSLNAKNRHERDMY